METDDILKYFSEMGYLKRLKHIGWALTGVKELDSVAEHAFRTAIIGYFLAQLEGADPNKVVTMCLFHDSAEARVGDQNKVSARYFDLNEAEATAFSEQVRNFTPKVANELLNNRIEFEGRTTKEGNVAKDADLLEQAISAKEYIEQGYAGAIDWISNVGKRIQTESAKKIWESLNNEKDFTNSWWQGLKNIPND